jgi:hypothetical protein
MLTNIKEITENGMVYYVIPSNYPLFKATKTYDSASGGLHLDPEGYYFFGVKDETPGYIESYEKEYGIIFEFITTRPYKLLALDKKATQDKLYQNAPEEIKLILENNYGYTTGLRDSETTSDHELAKYICLTGYDGYAIKHMSTVFKGSFHPEFMFCDITGINYVKKVTTDKRVNEILQGEKEKSFSKKLKEDRKNKRDSQNAEDNNLEKRHKPTSLFMDYEDEDEDEGKSGGTKRRSYKRRKTLKKGRKSNRKITRKTRKLKRKGKHI